MDRVPFVIAGQPGHSPDEFVVRQPYDGRVVGLGSYPGPDQVTRAVEAAWAVAPTMAALPAGARSAVLDRVGAELAARAGEFAKVITGESGLPIRWARAEVTRAISVFHHSAEQARRRAGELHHLDGPLHDPDSDPTAVSGPVAGWSDTGRGGPGRLALIQRMPIGPVLALTPADSPLAAVADSVAAALAVGAPVVVRPAPATPLTALLLGELLAAGTGLPAGAHCALPLSGERATELIADPRLPVLAYTGPARRAADLRRAVPDKHMVLRVGAGTTAVICEDWAADDDFAWAASRIAAFLSRPGGGGGPLRVRVHEWLYDGFLPRLVDAVRQLRTGDPYDEATQVGPLLDTGAAERIEAWVDRSVADGASIEAGGRRNGTGYPPTVLTGVPDTAHRDAGDLAGPVLTVGPVGTDEAAFSVAGSGRHLGVFTHNVRIAFAAYQTTQAASVVIGDLPEPYGGPAVSGSAPAGPGPLNPAALMDAYTTPRMLVLTGLAR